MNFQKRVNNFDLLRLCAALQVVASHGIHHLEPQIGEPVQNVLRMFHGVPIFFTISGYLIFLSFQRTTDLRAYARNRVLRIYPGLFAAFVLSAVLIGVFAPTLNGPDLAKWGVGQVTIFQYYTPASLRSYGVGAPNGSLWTIPVELEFYAVLPLAYLLWKKWGVAPLAVLFVASIAAYNAVFARFAPETMAYKLFMVTVLPYLYNFLVGVFVAVYFDKLRYVLVGRGFAWLAAYVTVNLLNLYVLHWWNVEYTPNLLGVVDNAMLGLTAISLAYTVPDCSSRLLRGNDISYGVYIYHMPVINVLVQRGMTGSLVDITAAALITVILALLSWTYLERRFLGMKQHRVGPLSSAVRSA